jgi:hypothetical protein
MRVSDTSRLSLGTVTIRNPGVWIRQLPSPLQSITKIQYLSRKTVAPPGQILNYDACKINFAKWTVRESGHGAKGERGWFSGGCACRQTPSPQLGVLPPSTHPLHPHPMSMHTTSDTTPSGSGGFLDSTQGEVSLFCSISTRQGSPSCMHFGYT